LKSFCDRIAARREALPDGRTTGFGEGHTIYFFLTLSMGRIGDIINSSIFILLAATALQ